MGSSTARKIWLKQGKSGNSRQILSDERLNEIFVNACLLHEANLGYTAKELRKIISDETCAEAVKKGLNMPTIRTIDNYLALLKQMGLKLVRRPRIRDIRRWLAATSFRNAVSTYAVATVTHEDVCEGLILNIDPTTVRYNFSDNQLFAAVVPKGTKKPVCILGKRQVCLPQQVKLLSVANYSGLLGPVVILCKVAQESIVDGSKIVKVPLYGCHPSIDFQTSIWFVGDISDAEIIEDYLRSCVPNFLERCREMLSRFGEEESRAVLWVDCGNDMTKFLASEDGSYWSKEQNLSVNIHQQNLQG